MAWAVSPSGVWKLGHFTPRGLIDRLNNVLLWHSDFTPCFILAGIGGGGAGKFTLSRLSSLVFYPGMVSRCRDIRLGPYIMQVDDTEELSSVSNERKNTSCDILLMSNLSAIMLASYSLEFLF